MAPTYAVPGLLIIVYRFFENAFLKNEQSSLDFGKNLVLNVISFVIFV